MGTDVYYLPTCKNRKDFEFFLDRYPYQIVFYDYLDNFTIEHDENEYKNQIEAYKNLETKFYKKILIFEE
jgi:hypothetical protein